MIDMKQQNYETPEMVIEILAKEDIICTSGMIYDPDNPSGGGGSTGWTD